MLPTYYEYFNPVKILAGKNALENIPYELGQLGCKRPILLTDRGVIKAGLKKIFIDALAGSKIIIAATYENIPQDSSDAVVNEIGELYRQNKCDCIIALGGGSVIDTAKGVNILITEEVNDIMQRVGAERINKKMKPLMVIPTTSGTGSESTLVAVIANVKGRYKMLFTSYNLLPNVSILDPRMTVTLPPSLTASTAMDALTHAVEAYSCLQKNPMSDAYAWAAINLIRQHLVKTLQSPRDEDARMALANASLMAGCAFSNSMVGMVHGIGHACGGVSGVPHSQAMAILLPYCMEYNMKKNADIYAELLLALAGPEEYAKTKPSDRAATSVAVIKEMNSTMNKLTGMPIRLRDAGVKEGDIPAIVKTALGDGAMVFNPEAVQEQDVLTILKSAF